jgi:hypothetical protein
VVVDHGRAVWEGAPDEPGAAERLDALFGHDRASRRPRRVRTPRPAEVGA